MLLNNLGTEVGLTNGTLGKLIAPIRIDSKTQAECRLVGIPNKRRRRKSPRGY